MRLARSVYFRLRRCSSAMRLSAEAHGLFLVSLARAHSDQSMVSFKGRGRSALSRRYGRLSRYLDFTIQTETGAAKHPARVMAFDILVVNNFDVRKESLL